MNDTTTIRQALRTAAFDEALADHLGLNPTDLRCLDLVIAQPGITPSRLAEVSGLTSGAITGVLDRLEKARFIERRPDPADRRSVTIQPVVARAADVTDAVAPLDAAIDRLLARSAEGERAAIGRFLIEAGGAVTDETARLRAQTRGGFVGRTFHAPIGDAVRGRLAFASGAPRLALNIAPIGPRASARIIAETSASRLEFDGAAPAGELVVATFDGPRPDVRSSGGIVTIRYRRQAVSAFATRMARIALSGAIPWSIELDGGLTDLTGSLEGVQLERLDVEGGTNHLSLDLPQPHGTSAVRLNGVASSASFRRPRGVPVAVRFAGGISRLRIDGRSRSDVSGRRRYVGEGFDASPDRYELEILGGASDVRVGERA